MILATAGSTASVSQGQSDRPPIVIRNEPSYPLKIYNEQGVEALLKEVKRP